MHLFFVLIAAALFNLHSFANGQSSPEMFHSTDGKSGEKPIQYRTSADNNNEQCNKPVGLTFNLPPKDGHCDDGLWICYLGILQQNIGISGSNFRAKRTFSVRDKNDMEIAKECAKKVATSASVADGGISNRWRGIKVYTKQTNGPNEGQKRDTIFETSIADKSFNIGTNLRKFSILFGDFHNGSFTTLSPAVAELHLSSEQHQLQIDFLDHQLQNGAFLADFAGLWLLGLDMLPMIKDSSQQQNAKLYIHSGCNCSMLIKSMNPHGPFTMVIEEKQCPSLPIDQAFSIGPTDHPSLPIDQTFSIGHTDRVPISVSFTALTDANINSMAVELLIPKVHGPMKMIQAPVVRQFVNTIESPDKRPIILAWNNFFIWSIFDFVDLQFGDKNCSYSCVYTEDISFEKAAFIVMWHTGDQLRDLPQHRRAEQLYVMMSHESPLLGSANFEKIPYNFFNISITYRSDSAIHIPYDALAPVTAQTLPQYIWTEAEIQKRMALKKRSAVQFVSNCHVPSGRDLLTARLQKLLQVDVYGKCNNRKCDDECYQREQESHFFYLAFENAVCTEYVTEKFWKALRNLIVPIVLSRKVMEEVGIPNGTFIAVDDFNSVKALADYLKELQKDTDKYMSYFKWTKTYQKHRSGNGIQPPLCQLCEIAHKQRHKDTFKTYAVQLDKFWPKTQCEPNFVQKRFKDI
ncbi:hypothetical protein niasHT_036160 [Heterodera trifolii]|uniref:Fucosyltransferase n=1 Tax=Heterodera trifolii TaxID=157864 RepID=A0ABD2IJ06_9BILA